MWALAVKILTKDEQQAIEFTLTDRLSTIMNLLQEKKQAEKKCKAKQWQYRRKRW